MKNSVVIWLWPCGTWTDDEQEFLDMICYKSDDYEVVCLTEDQYYKFVATGVIDAD